MFALETYTSKEPLDADYARRRQRFEPIYEVTQIKGDGEAHPSLSPDDEFADYETWDEGNLNLTPKKEGDIAHEYYREALKNGMMLAQSIGENPFKIGAAAGTDAHTAPSRRGRRARRRPSSWPRSAIRSGATSTAFRLSKAG